MSEHVTYTVSFVSVLHPSLSPVVCTCSLKGEDVSIALGRALGGVGFRAAAGETAGLPPRGAVVFCCDIQLWKHDNGRVQSSFQLNCLEIKTGL